MVREIALVEEGARMHHATSYHEDYMPKNVIDRSVGRPWMTNGSFPQSLVVSFPTTMQIHSVDIKAYNVREILLERSTNEAAANFEEFTERKTLAATKGAAQTESLSGTGSQAAARHLRLTIFSGHDLFCAVYRLVVTGEEYTGAPPPAKAAAPQQPFESAIAPKQGGFTFGGPQVQAAGSEGGQFQFGFTQPAAGRQQQQPEEEGQFQSTFRVPTSKKKRIIEETPITTGYDDEDPEDAATAAGIRDEGDDDDEDDDDELDVGGEEDSSSAAAPPAAATPWNPNLPGFGAPVPDADQAQFSDGDDQDDAVMAGRFGF